MNNRVLLATLAGGIVNFLLGWLIFGMLLMSTSQSTMTEAANKLMKDPPDIWAYALGSLVWALLLALLYSRWASISTFSTGAIAGAVIGLLVTLASGFNAYAGMNLWNDFTGLLISPLGAAVVVGLTGGVVGWTLGYRSGK